MQGGLSGKSINANADHAVADHQACQAGTNFERIFANDLPVPDESDGKSAAGDSA